MTIDEIIAFAQTLDGALTVTPTPGDGRPEVAWGDTFIYYAPDGLMPQRTQPYATIVTKNYPDDEQSDLDRPDAFRVNIAVARTTFHELIGSSTRESTNDHDYAARDAILPHPVYGRLGWIAVVNPGPASEDPVRRLLTEAHEAARARYARRTQP
jgi:hypothetical protein